MMLRLTVVFAFLSILSFQPSWTQEVPTPPPTDTGTPAPSETSSPSPTPTCVPKSKPAKPAGAKVGWASKSGSGKSGGGGGGGGGGWARIRSLFGWDASAPAGGAGKAAPAKSTEENPAHKPAPEEQPEVVACPTSTPTWGTEPPAQGAKVAAKPKETVAKEAAPAGKSSGGGWSAGWSSGGGKAASPASGKAADSPAAGKAAGGPSANGGGKGRRLL